MIITAYAETMTVTLSLINSETCDEKKIAGNKANSIS